MTSQTPETSEQPFRDGSPPNDGPVGGPPGPSAEIDSEEAPSGLPDEDAPESDPLGPSEVAPEGEAPPRHGEEHMPGIPTGGEPPTAG